MQITDSSTLWKSAYKLIDSGNQEKLERFGSLTLRRPEPQAIWKPDLTESEWQHRADASFVKEGNSAERGAWQQSRNLSQRWPIMFQSDNMKLKFLLSLSSFKHVGLFPEQAVNWEYIYTQVQEQKKWINDPEQLPNVLNLFAYTGGATLAARAAGASVTHVDSVKPVLSWASSNANANQMDGIRWMAEDAARFVSREVRRGQQYEGIILDPPAYGRGSKGERWILEENIQDLLEDCSKLLKPKGFVVLNLYSMGYSALIAANLLTNFFGTNGHLTCGELIVTDAANRSLPLGIFARMHNI